MTARMASANSSVAPSASRQNLESFSGPTDIRLIRPTGPKIPRMRDAVKAGRRGASAAAQRPRPRRRAVIRNDRLLHPHLPPPLLHPPPPLLLAPPPRLRRAARLGLHPLARGDVGLGDEFRQPPPRFLAVGFLGAVGAGGEDDLAFVGPAAARQLLQPRVDGRVEAELEDVAAQLHRGGDLVDVLAAGAGRGEELLLQRL